MKLFYEHVRSFGTWFWNPKFWLPSNITWDDLQNQTHVRYPQFDDLWIPIALAFLIISIRYLFERLIAYPLGTKFNLKDNRNELKKLWAHHSKAGSKLENFYTKHKHHIHHIITTSPYLLKKTSSVPNQLSTNPSNGHLKHRKGDFRAHDEDHPEISNVEDIVPCANGVSHKLINSLKLKSVPRDGPNIRGIEGEMLNVSSQTGYTLSHVIKYMRRRRALEGTGKLVKFGESCWRFVFYLAAFTYGLVVLHKKPWFWDTAHCWHEYPFQHLTDDIFWYYMVEMAFYWSLMASQFWDTKRKDFWQMFIHHVCALLLLTFSYVANMVRIGTLVLVIHDAVDYWLEAVKLSNYCKCPRLCSFFFASFALIWFVTRLVIFPYRVVYPAIFQAHVLLKAFFAAYYVYNVLLLLLLGLNVAWFYTICVMAYKSIKYGEIKKDERSSSEDSQDDVQMYGNGSTVAN